MPTPAYVDYLSTKPDGTTNPTTFSGDDQTQQQKLRDMVITGRVAGFVTARSTGSGASSSRPQFIGWINAAATLGFRMNFTWGGTSNAYVTAMQWEWSNDCTLITNGTWTIMGSASTVTYDGNDAITGTTNNGSVFFMILENMVRVLKLIDSFTAHVAATGVAVHGLGDVSTQSSSNLTCSNGALNATLGQTTPKAADVTRIRENFSDLGSIGAGGTATLDLSTLAHFACTAPGATSSFTVAMSNVPASGKSQTFMLEIIGGQRSSGVISWPTNWKWIGGTAPTQSAFQSGTGRDLFSATVRDGGTRIEVTYLGRGG